MRRITLPIDGISKTTRDGVRVGFLGKDLWVSRKLARFYPGHMEIPVWYFQEITGGEMDERIEQISDSLGCLNYFFNERQRALRKGEEPAVSKRAIKTLCDKMVCQLQALPSECDRAVICQGGSVTKGSPS